VDEGGKTAIQKKKMTQITIRLRRSSTRMPLLQFFSSFKVAT